MVPRNCVEKERLKSDGTRKNMWASISPHGKNSAGES